MAYYDLKKKPALTTKEGETAVLYPQLISAGTIHAKRLIELTAQRSGLKGGMLEGALTALFDVVTDWLNQGYSVEMGEFGFFTGKISGEKTVEKKTDIRAQSLRFNNVNFRPSARFKKALNGTLERIPQKSFHTSADLTQEQLKQLLMEYLEKHRIINIPTYERLTGRLKWKATQDLKAFEQQGLIESQGRGTQKYYICTQRTDKKAE